MSMHRRTTYLMLASVALVLTAGARAQAPFSVVVKPTMNPLPIGLCAAVHLTLLDTVSGKAARNAAGYYMSLADFDMTVSAPDERAVAGQQVDASHWSVCGCQVARKGTVATITASYPAARVKPEARVPGVSFQTTATFTLAAAIGDVNSPECVAQAAAALAGGIAPKSAIEPTGGPAVAKVPARTPAVTQSAASAVTTQTSPPTPLPNQVGGATPTSRGTPTAAPPPPPGPAPTDLEILGTPAEATIKWFPPHTFNSPQPTGYVVERSKVSDPDCCRATSPLVTGREWRDPLMWPGTWMYKVSAIYADGRRGSAQRSHVYVGPTTPTGLKAVQRGRDTVVLTWTKVKDASHYIVAGPPTNMAARVDSTRAVMTGVPAGIHTFKVSSGYEGAAGQSTPKAGSAFDSVRVTVVRRHYRIFAEAIRVDAETTDDFWSGDGFGDEVFVASIAELIDRPKWVLLRRDAPVMSVIHGDVLKYPAPEGVRAGTATGYGGLRRNDVATPVLGPPRPSGGGPPLMVLWEGELLDSAHVLLLHPVIWDVDTPASYLQRRLHDGVCINTLCGWRNYFNGPGNATSNMATVKAAASTPQISVIEGAIVWTNSGSFMVHLENIDKDRPIGMEVPNNGPQGMGLVAQMRDRVVVLSREKIEAALGPGSSAKVEMRFWDHSVVPGQLPAPVGYLGGDYTLIMRIERMP
jgi:hypothetical protein